MLHTLSTSPWHSDIAGMIRLMAEGDDLLLLADGVLAAVENSHFLEILRAAPISIHVLNVDVQARGLCAQISSDVIMVSYTDFVRLTGKHPDQMTWYCHTVVYYLTPFRHGPKISRPHII